MSSSSNKAKNVVLEASLWERFQALMPSATTIHKHVTDAGLTALASTLIAYGMTVPDDELKLLFVAAGLVALILEQALYPHDAPAVQK